MKNAIASFRLQTKSACQNDLSLIYFSILGRIIRITDDVIEYRKWIRDSYPAPEGVRKGISTPPSFVSSSVAPLHVPTAVIPPAPAPIPPVTILDPAPEAQNNEETMRVYTHINSGAVYNSSNSSRSSNSPPGPVAYDSRPEDTRHTLISSNFDSSSANYKISSENDSSKLIKSNISEESQVNPPASVDSESTSSMSSIDNGNGGESSISRPASTSSMPDLSDGVAVDTRSGHIVKVRPPAMDLERDKVDRDKVQNSRQSSHKINEDSVRDKRLTDTSEDSHSRDQGSNTGGGNSSNYVNGKPETEERTSRNHAHFKPGSQPYHCSSWTRNNHSSSSNSSK